MPVSRLSHFTRRISLDTLKSVESDMGAPVVYELHLHQLGLEGGIRLLDEVESTLMVVSTRVICPYELRILIVRRQDPGRQPNVHEPFHDTYRLGQRFGLLDENVVGVPVEPVLGGLGGLGGLGVHRIACLCDNIRVPLYVSPTYYFFHRIRIELGSLVK